MYKSSIVSFLLVLAALPVPLAAQRRAAARGENIYDLLIVGGTVVTMDQNRRVIENGAVAIGGGQIARVGTAAEMRGVRAARTIDARGSVVIPGLINTHTHIPMTLFRGISDDLDLNDWLTKYIFPAEAKNVDEAFVRVGTRLGLAEMIRGGTTTYCDMYYFEDAVADETKKAGVRGVLGETIIQFPVADNKTPEDALRYSERYINKWKNDPLITPALAPHAPYTLSTEQLLAVKRLGDKLNATILIHVAETKKERDDLLAQKNATPVNYLNSIGFLGPRVIAAHTVFVTDAEIGKKWTPPPNFISLTRATLNSCPPKPRLRWRLYAVPAL
ncbi:MAG: amidohydrolase family protein [Acidobacteria bacterium]|nr:amidohydrolase family protein [Acidobacteriota bacterium]